MSIHARNAGLTKPLPSGNWGEGYNGFDFHWADHTGAGSAAWNFKDEEKRAHENRKTEDMESNGGKTGGNLILQAAKRGGGSAG